MIGRIPPMLVPTFARIGLTLAHFVWQAAAIAVLLALVLWLMRKRSANARYVTSLAAFVLMAAMPVATLWYAGSGSHGVPATLHSEPVQLMKDSGEDASMLGEISPLVEAVRTPSAPGPGRTAGLMDLVCSLGINDALCGGALLWAVGVLLLAVRLMIGWLGLHRLRRKNTEALPESVGPIVRQLLERLGLRQVTVLGTRGWNEPVAFGLLRPTVLVPLSVLTQCPPELIEALVAHELAHIRRYDLWVNLLQRITETLLFYHPAVWWVSGRIRLERELCCDDLAVRITNRRAEYATALVEISRLARRACAPVLAAGVISPRISMLERARRVLRMQPARPAAPRLSYWIAGPLSIALAASIGFVTVTWSTPSAAAITSATTQPDAKQQPDLLRPPPETKTYVFSWQGASLEEMLSEFSKETGMSVRGEFDRTEAMQEYSVTYQSVRPLPFDDALLLFDRLIENRGYWMVRRNEFLDLKHIVDFYRDIPPDHVYTSVETYRRANLPAWDIATVLYEPKVQPVARLANMAMDNVPDNMARASIAFDDRRLELKGIVHYINRQLDLLERVDTGTPASLPSAYYGEAMPGPARPQPAPRSQGKAAVEVRSLTEGVVAKVHVQPGQEIKAGDLLVELEDEEIKLELEAAKLRLKGAERRDEQQDFRVKKGLQDPATRQPEEAVALAKLDVQRWELRLARTTIRAPQAGRVSYILESPGRKVAPGDLVAALEPAASPPPATRPASRK